MSVDPELLSALIGRRVSLRHRRRGSDGGRPPGPPLTDALGDLDGGPRVWIVHTRRGPVEVRAEDVTAVRAVPPAPPRRGSPPA